MERHFWPTGQDRLNRLFADYYTAVPDGVVNDRWTTPKPINTILRFGPARALVNHGLRQRIRKSAGASKGIIPPPVPHSDFRTPEYARFPEIQIKKWEATRGMSHSFGFNRNDTEGDYAPFDTLLGDFIDGVAKNGNLLLNVGPEPGGRIAAPQAARLKAFGAWLRANGEAIYGARPWVRADAVTTDGGQVRFTRRGADLYLIVLGAAGERLTIRDLDLRGAAVRLEDGATVLVDQAGADLTLTFTSACRGAATAIRIAGAA